jgi:hypothetical protein
LFLTLLTASLYYVPTSVLSKDAVQPNAAGTWCYYPSTKNVHNIACSGDRNDQQLEFNTVLHAHLNQTISIGYYALDNSRLGNGAEWVLTTTAGQVRICLSGKDGDGYYETRCGDVTADNSLKLCRLAQSQTAVTDGCYEPGQPYASPAVKPSSGSLSACIG